MAGRWLNLPPAAALLPSEEHLLLSSLLRSSTVSEVRSFAVANPIDTNARFWAQGSAT